MDEKILKMRWIELAACLIDLRMESDYLGPVFLILVDMGTILLGKHV